MRDLPTDSQLALRDRLALDRTHLANERTFLAYVRTAIMIVISALSLWEVYPQSRLAQAGGWLLLPTGLVVVCWGLQRFANLRRDVVSCKN